MWWGSCTVHLLLFTWTPMSNWHYGCLVDYLYGHVPNHHPSSYVASKWAGNRGVLIVKRWKHKATFTTNWVQYPVEMTFFRAIFPIASHLWFMWESSQWLRRNVVQVLVWESQENMGRCPDRRDMTKAVESGVKLQTNNTLIYTQVEKVITKCRKVLFSSNTWLAEAIQSIRVVWVLWRHLDVEFCVKVKSKICSKSSAAELLYEGKG